MGCFPSTLDFMAPIAFTLSPASSSLNSAGLPHSVLISYFKKLPSLKITQQQNKFQVNGKEPQIRILLSSFPANDEVIKTQSIESIYRFFSPRIQKGEISFLHIIINVIKLKI